MQKEGEAETETAKEQATGDQKPKDCSGLEAKSEESFQKGIQLALGAAERQRKTKSNSLHDGYSVCVRLTGDHLISNSGHHFFMFNKHFFCALKYL